MSKCVVTKYHKLHIWINQMTSPGWSAHIMSINIWKCGFRIGFWIIIWIVHPLSLTLLLIPETFYTWNFSPSKLYCMGIKMKAGKLLSQILLLAKSMLLPGLLLFAILQVGYPPGKQWSMLQSPNLFLLLHKFNCSGISETQQAS